MQKFYLAGCALILCVQMATGQCFPDRHSTNWFDGWASCEADMSPNPERGQGHWIMYDYGSIYALGQMQVWNVNDPDHLDWGMRDVEIDVSVDGINWEHAGSFAFEQGAGHNTYEGFTGPDLGGIEARYLLITATSNWGGTCFGLSEVQIEAEETTVSTDDPEWENPCFTAEVIPNPFHEYARVMLDVTCAGLVHYRVIDLLGNVVFRQSEYAGVGSHQLVLALRDLPAGGYVLDLQINDLHQREKLLKMNR